MSAWPLRRMWGVARKCHFVRQGARSVWTVLVGMRRIPLTLTQANEAVATLHRHHKPVVGHRFSIGLESDGKMVGAVIVDRPVARKTDQYMVAEVTRLVTDGTKNACSSLYAAAARAAEAMGFEKIQTFILESEPGTSLLAAGWKHVGDSAGGDWTSVSKPNRRTDQPMCPKQRWEKILAKHHPPERTHQGKPADPAALPPDRRERAPARVPEDLRPFRAGVD